MSKIVNGKSCQPLSGAPPRRIVLLLHGYGSNGADLISIAPMWQHALPDALFLAPDAPHPCDMGMGYQWWPLADLSPDALARGAQNAAGTVDDFITRKLTQYDLTEADLAIVGFSQGTMLALHVGPRRSRQVAAIVGYSGMLTGAAQLRRETVTKPPVLLVHGDADPVVPFAAMADAETALAACGFDVDSHAAPGVGHSVDPEGLRLGAEFIARHFAD
ncbi:alpha/beta hydrolase [Croceicoccus hydrothermalis]|uniref:alpha/beta hydrolase n=1 Tax=Croceicoccus hydrothermalis TaxID=2867964 RepID=UPI001EFA64C9|nr:dienelactone hydrolase family protein [Croceicoccus hydrothermalis]